MPTSDSSVWLLVLIGVVFVGYAGLGPVARWVGDIIAGCLERSTVVRVAVVGMMIAVISWAGQGL